MCDWQRLIQYLSVAQYTECITEKFYCKPCVPSSRFEFLLGGLRWLSAGSFQDFGVKLRLRVQKHVAWMVIVAYQILEYALRMQTRLDDRHPI